jgi:hypothetical protein
MTPVVRRTDPQCQPAAFFAGADRGRAEGES